MGEMIREVCFVSLFAAIACSVAPQGQVRTIMNILSSVILILVVLKPMASLDMREYAASVAKYREMEQRLSLEAEDMSTRLNRLVIEEEYETYIRDKAVEYGICLSDVKVKLEWHPDGCWVPVAAEIAFTEESGGVNRLKTHLKSQLGLPEEKQLWYQIE